VGTDALGIRRRGIRGELGASLATAPLLTGANKRAADAPAPVARENIPSFKIGHAITHAPFGARANRQLHEPDQPVGVLGDPHRRRFERPAGDELTNLRAMLLRGRIRPQLTAKLQPLVSIGCL